jgi:hypothetical protein
MKKLLSSLVFAILLLTTAPADANANYRLTITFQKSASAKPVTWQLTCRPAGGTHPAAKLACQEIRVATEPFVKPPKLEACTQIYGGAEVAKVTGRWAGQRVNRTFTRTNGCEIARWDQLQLTLSSKSN